MSKIAKETLADETEQLVNRIAEYGVDGVIGGFPCQDISVANSDGEGVAGSRSGLFRNAIITYRLVGAFYLLLENVAALLTRGMGEVLGALASSGCDAEWDCVSAGSVGAPHFRAREYILAYPRGTGGERKFPKKIQRQPEFSWCEDVRRLEDLPDRSDLYPSKLCGGGIRTTKRLHGIGNGNPPCVIRELTKGLTTKGSGE